MICVKNRELLHRIFKLDDWISSARVVKVNKAAFNSNTFLCPCVSSLRKTHLWN